MLACVYFYDIIINCLTEKLSENITNQAKIEFHRKNLVFDIEKRRISSKSRSFNGENTNLARITHIMLNATRSPMTFSAGTY